MKLLHGPSIILKQWSGKSNYYQMVMLKLYYAMLLSWKFFVLTISYYF